MREIRRLKTWAADIEAQASLTPREGLRCADLHAAAGLYRNLAEAATRQAEWTGDAVVVESYLAAAGRLLESGGGIRPNDDFIPSILARNALTWKVPS